MDILIHARKALDSYVIWNSEKNTFSTISSLELNHKVIEEQKTIIGVELKEDKVLKITSQPKQYYMNYLVKSGHSCDGHSMKQFNQARMYAKTLI
jgi:hypothetical protein